MFVDVFPDFDWKLFDTWLFSNISLREKSWTTYWGHILLERLSGEAGYMPDDGREVGGAPELQPR